MQIGKLQSTFDNIAIRTISKIGIPIILLFGFYIQFYGESSPGGGFQSGAIFTTAFILHDVIKSLGGEYKKTFISSSVAIKFSAMGALIYQGTGLLCVILGGNFLDYNFLSPSANIAQQIGISAIETGIAMTVFGSLTLIYNSFRNILIKKLQEK